MTRREVLAEMLRRYREAEAAGGRSGGGSGLSPLMPPTWNSSYRQLAGLLERLAADRPKQHRHLMARYVDVPVSRQRLKRRGGGWVGLAGHAEVRISVQLADRAAANEWDCLVADWPAWVREHEADLGLGWLEGRFRGEPYLPVEMVKAS